MGLILARVRLKCPKTGEEVELIKDCMDPQGNGESCENFKHYGIQGSLIVIACKLNIDTAWIMVGNELS